MDPESVRKCMSLGYSSKKANTTIGQCKYFSCLHKKTIVIFFLIFNFLRKFNLENTPSEYLLLKRNKSSLVLLFYDVGAVSLQLLVVKSC